MAPILPNAKLLARAFHRVPSVTTTAAKGISSTASAKAWEGKKPEEHANNESDSHNVQVDAVKEGKAERASGDGSAAASEKDKDKMNQKGKDEHPEAPGVVIGMNDERGGVSSEKIPSQRINC